jgi:DNA-directed RNA polymerase II subunit RPB2
LECLAAKYYTIKGSSISLTPFDDFDRSDVEDGLDRLGYNKYGDEIMYSGFTGYQLSCEVFIGPTYYFRLKHMVSDKINYRTDDGKIVSLTKQPPKGRSNEGGLRIGEMETNVLLAYGFGAFAKESMMERSDKYRVYVDDNGNLASRYKKQNSDIHPIDIPYTYKLLTQELAAASIKTSFELREKDDDEEYLEDEIDKNDEDRDDENERTKTIDDEGNEIYEEDMEVEDFDMGDEEGMGDDDF